MAKRLISIDTAMSMLNQLPNDVQTAILALWAANYDDAMVHKAGAETISGAKTFAAKTNAAEIDISPLAPSTDAILKLIGAKTWAQTADAAGVLKLTNQTDGVTPFSIAGGAIANALRILSAAVTLGVDLDLAGKNLLNVGNVNAANGLLQLDGNGRIPSAQLTVDAMQYKGTWNASTNSPALADGTGSPGDVYRVGTAGTQNLGSGAQTFDVGDWVTASDSVIWQKADMTDAVASVAGLTGAIAAADLRTALSLVVGVNVQAYSGQLLAIANLTNADNNILQRKSGAWTSRTVAQYLADLVAGGLPYDLSMAHTAAGSQRAVGYGLNALGVRLQRAFTLKAVNYRINTDDASGNTAVEIRKNGTQIASTAVSLSPGNLTGNGYTVTGLTVAFAAGDVLTVYLSGVGTTPGTGLTADLLGVTA